MSDDAKSSRAGLAAIAIVAFLVLVAVIAYFQTRDDRPRLLLVGDSITAISEKRLTASLDGRWKVSVSGAPKRTAPQRIDDLPLLEAIKPEAVVINLGTNDVIQQVAPDATITAITKIAAAFPAARCLALVTVNEDMYNARDATLGPDAKAVNDRIVALAKDKGWKIIRWDLIVKQYRAEGEKQGHLTADTIHPGTVGQKLLADAYSRALVTCPDVKR